MRRLVSLALAALGVIGIVLALPARPASAHPAHPLGNFSVNQAIGLDLYPDRVAVTAIVDLAELPTLQERPAVDTNGDGTVSAPESMAYNTRVCNAMAGAVALRVDGHRVQWSVRPAGFAYRPGSAGLHTSRVSCAFKAAADLTRPATADLVNGYRADRVGWREITAAGHGVHIVHPPVPVRSVTNSLRSISVRPGCGSSRAMGRALARPST
jgi:nickel/cobalt exporter